MRHFRSTASEQVATAEHRACAEWFVEELRGIGFSASVRERPGRPIVVGHDRGSGGPSVLFCGHYEIRPRDLSHGNLPDQSTELMAFVEACRAWKAVAGQLPTAVSVLVEGEGWAGALGLASFMHMYADELKANIGLAPAARRCCAIVPAINSVLRGVCCEEFTIAVDGDRLAGVGRGAATDPTRILARILGDLHDSSGRVTIPGFYAGINASPRSPNIWSSGDEHIEAIPMEPTCEIEVVNGSRTDAGGVRTAARSFARLSFHLVCGQEPDVVSQAFRDFARARIPRGCRIEFVPVRSAPPLRFTASSPVFLEVQHALTVEWDRKAVFACGDAAPAVHALSEILGMEAIVISFTKHQGDCHGQRGSSELAKNYQVGIRSWVRILDALAR